ncbi:MAG TPA: AAA family ATPase [Acidothermaceae bacterium]|nr:AAA family ATPase [Acidothermaceae bacterium]
MSATVADVAVVRGGLSAVMVGRAAELRRLQAMALGLVEPRVALISGEPGVGKSRLVREFVATLADQPVLVGHAEPGELGRPFHVVQSALQPIVADWTSVPPALESRQAALRVLLAPVAPGLGAEPRGDAPSARVVGEENITAAVELVRCILDGRPAVLVAEDLHWADAESLLLISRLATTPDLPLLVVGTFRPGVARGWRLADMLDRVARQRMVEQFELRPLTEGQVAEWLGIVYEAPVSYRVASDLTRRTSGNPFFLEELVTAAPDATLDELCCLPLPVSISEAVLRHIEGLDADQRRIADAAAVLGRRIPFDLLAAVTGAGEDELIDAMRSLVDRGLVVEIEPDLFTFRHALTREAVAQRLLGRQRRRLHEKAYAALLEMGSDDWGALAYHAAGAHLWEELIEAARRGAEVNLRTGSTYEALRLAELGLTEAEADPELLLLATRAAWACGLTESALSYATQLMKLAEAAGDDGALSRALRAVSRLRWEKGDIHGRDEVIDRLLRLAKVLPQDADLAAVYGHLAEVRMLDGQSAEAVEWADRAIALINAGADDSASSALPAALVNKGSALIDMAGHFDEGANLLAEAIDVAVDRGDVLSALRGSNNLLQGVLVRWPREKVSSLVGRAQSLAERFGWQDWNIDELGANYQSEVVGDLPAAIEVLDKALADPLADHSAKRAWVLGERVWLALEAGDPTAAAMFDEVRAAIEAAFNHQHRQWLNTLEIDLAARLGDTGRASRALDQLAANAGGGVEPCVLLAGSWGGALLGALRAGVSADRVRDVFELVRVSDRRVARDDDDAWTAHVEAALAAASGDHERAIAFYRTALAEPPRRPGVPIVADVHMALAQSLLAIGDIEAARESVEVAAALLSRWKGWRVDQLSALQSRLAGGGARSASGQLTARERDVAVLVAQGLSNGEIGRRLFISTKTASVHVSNILAKLNMTSRSQIAAWVSSEGLN